MNIASRNNDTKLSGNFLMVPGTLSFGSPFPLASAETLAWRRVDDRLVNTL